MATRERVLLVDRMVRMHHAHAVVRYNGGPQAAHHVVRSDGVWHSFSQFGSGTFVSGVTTFLSRHMLIDPLAIMREADVLEVKGVGDALQRLTVDPACVVVTPIHKIINRMLEVSRGEGRHGSCGRGVGQAAEEKRIWNHALRAKDLCDYMTIEEKLHFSWRKNLQIAERLVDLHQGNDRLVEMFHTLEEFDISLLIDEYLIISRVLNLAGADHLARLVSRGDVIFEGAHGVLLDAKAGFHPHVTSTTTTFENAEELLSSARYTGSSRRIGVLRAYCTRHGAGPFVTEDETLSHVLPELHNEANEWSGAMRIGWFDRVAVDYALQVTEGVQEIVLTNLDRLEGIGEIKVCTAYNNGSRDVARITPLAESEVHADLTGFLKRCTPVYSTHPPLPHSSPSLSVQAMDFIGSLHLPVSMVTLGVHPENSVELEFAHP